LNPPEQKARLFRSKTTYVPSTSAAGARPQKPSEALGNPVSSALDNPIQRGGRRSASKAMSPLRFITPSKTKIPVFSDPAIDALSPIPLSQSITDHTPVAVRAAHASNTPSKSQAHTPKVDRPNMATLLEEAEEPKVVPEATPPNVNKGSISMLGELADASDSAEDDDVPLSPENPVFWSDEPHEQLNDDKK
jgi:hypothetical protein